MFGKRHRRRRAASGRRWWWIAAFVIALPVSVVGGAYGWLATSVPDTDSEASITGLWAPVTALRDGFGVPHIFAESPADAVAALGYVHAQDRLWQMEGMRRLGAGRLSEVVGPAALPTDRFMRRVGLYRLAEAQSTSLSVCPGS